MAFVERAIEVSLTLGQGDFGGGQGNSVDLKGYRVQANISKAGAPAWDAAEVRIFGVSLSIMNSLTRLGKPLAYPRNNTITVKAGDADSGMSQVFSGTIMTAYGDFDGLPEANLFVSAIGNLVEAAKPQDPTSFPQPAKAATVVQQIASLMGKDMINDGVDVTLTGSGGGGPYFAGTAMQQLAKAAEMGNFQYITNGGSAGESVEIWPNGKSRGQEGPEIGPTTGLVGYPKYSDAGALVTALFMPGMGLGQKFTLKTSIDPAAGTWFVLHLNYELEALNPHGENPWFMHIEAQRASLAS